MPAKKRKVERQKRIAAWLDRGEGECYLRDRRIAELVENALLYFDGERYRLLAWCVMPNHVHGMIETMSGHPLDGVLHSWKSYTAKEANRILKRRAAVAPEARERTFWQTEYHDRFIRDDDHFGNVLRYIEHNPVAAGLVAKPEDWRWSSAWKGKIAGGTPALPAQSLLER